MAHTDAHDPVRWAPPALAWRDRRDERRLSRPRGVGQYARQQQGCIRAAERAACRDAVRGAEVDIDTRHRHNAAWMAS